MECEDVYHCLCAYLDGELEPERVAPVEEHLRSCPVCRRELELQQAVKFLIQERFPNVAMPDHLRRRVIAELGRVEEYRESGIQALDLIRWGTHIAQFYNTKSDLTEVLVPYVEKGLAQNELCVWVTFEMSEQEAKGALLEEIPRLQKYIDTGQLQLLSYKDWYLPEGYFDSRCPLESGRKKYQEALASGYAGLRITGNASWLEQSDWDSFMEYEDLVNSFVPDYRVLLVCTYKESKCTTDNIVDVMNAHRYVISKIHDSWRLRRSV